MRAVFFNVGNSVRSGWKLLGYFLLTALFVGGSIFLRRMLPDGVRPFVSEPLLAFLGALLATRVCTRLERTSLAAAGFSPTGPIWRDLGLGLLGGAAAVLLVAVGVWLLDGLHLVRAPEGTVSGLLRGAWTMLVASLFEETVFRGYAFQRAVQGMGARWAQVLFAVLFTLAHPFPPEMEGSVMALAMLNTFMAGWVFGLCYLRTGHLALPVGAHWGWNWVLGSLGFGVSGNDSKGWWTPVFHGKPTWLTGGDYGLEASVVTAGVLVLILVGLTRWKGHKTVIAPVPLTPPIIATGL
ncbi:CPBP family intramembrane glutamic endopeptidase [Pyxidicoccus xibeiensis]|uniref:CPBP family intramembrane glutamic endopeptidase n=1 Tax=Pyxidicoccus xibeiensis TaxID=2906759 RepID=UPI0020A75E67|nr:CPBP family intramembrane glutamic endopeptidase [Pyxidicoccus xibeiensis]MCP3140381.1 CPBP family intramembrane metalloprotease [Pyxidicoccus xibeiensis]